MTTVRGRGFAARRWYLPGRGLNEAQRNPGSPPGAGVCVVTRVADAVAGLGQERGLHLKDPAAMPVDKRLPGIFLGFRISPGGLGPGPKAPRRLRRRLRHTDGIDPDHLARSLQAFRGMWGALGG